jgi:hypothetical protein
MRLRNTAAALAAVALLTPALFAQPQSHPNSEKYKDSGIRNASGRSGSASIEARALFNRNNTTDLELTTGSFDSNAAAPGSITHVQMQLPNGGTKNFNGTSSGTFATNFTGAGPHAHVAVQTNVRDIDGARTDVVSVDEIVKRRPDLLLAGITAPQSGIRGRNVLIRATIRELNGDTGARTDLRLFADGVLVDRAEGAWIDANGMVDVSFAPTINTTGTVRLTVVADSVNPGDWDDSNNSASTTIEMKDQLGEFYSWSANGSEEEFKNYRYEKYSWGEFTDDQHGTNQSFGFNGVLRSDFAHEAMKATIEVTSDGKPLYNGETTEFEPSFRTRFGRCTSSRTYQPEVTVCYHNDMMYTTVDIYSGASDVTYRSYGWATQRSPWSPTEPRFEWDTTYTQDTVQNRFGSNVKMKVDFAASGSSWSAAPVMAIGAPETWKIDRNYGCYWEDFFGYEVCNEVHTQRSTRSGNASGFSN